MAEAVHIGILRSDPSSEEVLLMRESVICYMLSTHSDTVCRLVITLGEQGKKEDEI